MIGISSCLCGLNCTYAGKNNLEPLASYLIESKLAIQVCPEVLGGLSIPRTPCEIVGDKVLSIDGKDFTQEYNLGAKKALKILKDNDVDVFFTKFRSPSCGNRKVYDGTFSHKLVDGDGIAVKLFKENGIKVFSENEIEEFKEYIRERGIRI
ncbi:MAG: DUF523 domain-containing protein [Thomasclavelia sp.]|jgi:uncharacterized protein YbbK (DUF523 family)|nr:DUF523 domain-containing protein [Thomasclavelia sp.]